MFDETREECWQSRYGVSPPEGAPDLGSLLAHRSIRQFEQREIPDPTRKALMAASQSAATSSNLQLWSAVSVQDSDRRRTIAKLSGNQSQIIDCDWFVVFLADHYRLRKAAGEIGETASGLDYAEFHTMAVIDASLAAERMVCAAESLGIGICYIGAVRNDLAAVDRFLELPDGVIPLFGLCLGYPLHPLTAKIKPRLAQKCVWFDETYSADAGVGDYDERMQRFYESEGMKGDVTWSMRSGRRVDDHHLTGREVLLDHIQNKGFSRR